MNSIAGKISLGLVLIATICMASASRKVGGIGDEKEPDEGVKEVVTSVTDEIKSSALASLTQSGGNADANAFKDSPVEILAYKTQLVAGVNYFVKVRISNSIFHVRIYKPLSGSTELTKVIGPKAETDPINYF